MIGWPMYQGKWDIRKMRNKENYRGARQDESPAELAEKAGLAI